MRNNYFKSLFVVMIMFFGYSAFGQTERQKEQITSRYDKQKIDQLLVEFQNKTNQEKQRVDALAQIRNLQKRFESNGRLLELKKITPEGQPIYFTTFNVDAARSTRTNHLNSGGSLGLNLNGQNMTAHVWDGGLARASHQEYDGAGGSNRFSVGDGTSALHYHSAHVTGTIMASGVVANSKGMAPHAKAIGYDWNSDLAEATTAAGNGMLISNHSYGYATRNPNTGQPWLPDHYFGGYIDDSRDWDNLMFNAPNYLMVVAAGNDGNDNTANGAPLDGNSSYDKLTGHSTSKNNLVVANAQDANIDGNGNLTSVVINSSSSEGPTDDYRIKPDITGNGTSVYSTYESSDTAYNSITGTSMASPNVAGTLLILQQHANNVNGSFMKASTLKGLALHTADDAGPSGPDAVYGWGLLNAKRAAEAITDNGNTSKIEELTLTSGQSYQITVDSDGVNDLMASISWTDRAGTANTITNNNTPVLVNDLDIRVSKGGTTYNPWKLTSITTNGTGDNNVDPYERVDVANASGTYTITVTHKGSLTGGSQNYSLIITGLSSTPVVCNATTPTGLNVDGFGSSTATISWDAVPGASYDVRYRETGGSWTTVNVGGASASLTGLTPLTSYEVQVRSVCPDTSTSSYSGSVNFTTTEVQLNYCDSASTNINDEYIGRVQLNTIDNASGGQFYTDFTNISTDLTKNSQYTITVTPTWTGTVYSEGYSVWIDYNKDGDFDDAGEQVWTQSATQTTPVSGSFTVPSGATDGATRMRVSMSYNAIPSACGSFTYGEVEDYTVNIGGGTPDTTKPVITLVGASTINLNQGDTYNEQGATATDNVDGNITANIVIGGDTVDTNTVGTYVVTYNVSDAAGNAADEVTRTVNVAAVADTTPPVITLIGASTINLTVGDTYNELGATATDNVDGDLTSSIVITGNVNTAVAGTYSRFYNVSDAAGNAASQVTRTVNVSEPSSGCSGGISTFPYTEGFENTLGAWTQSTADDIDWTVDANGTPSSNTGPGSASQGSYYIYVEASSPNYPSKRAILNSPCFDLSGMTSPTFDFDYHMYGASDMGTIDLEASTDEGDTWTSIWNESGNKGNQWNSASVDLSAYAGGTVQLRFNRFVGSTWQADIAIDNINLSEPAAPTCSDGIQNGDETGVDCGGSSCAPCQTGSVVIHQGFFEAGWDNWVDGGSDAARYSGANSYEGSYSIRLRDNTSTSTMTLSNVDVSPYTQVEVEFYFYPWSMENGEDFWLQYNDGSGFTTVAAYAAGTSFNNGSFYVATVTLDAATYNLVSNAGFRFRCDASGNSDYIYIDQVTITGITNGTSSDNTITSLGGGYTITSTENGNDKEFSIYPNPVSGNILNVKLLDDAAVSYRVINMIGQTVLSGELKDQQINVESLKSGMYFIEINDGEEIMTKKFIRR
ncbi:MAG: DUF5011 domain-containing protein [Flavobacteriaceae bacterium]|nr:DUF5011 domain-containing protein [Flavobacteriaceae bacterium]